ncbi:MAG: PDZ domain-containing protein [Patescibacteria group bacterium]|jgi:hypothetical protein|nr:PDZ domain-containing protein [Patescibacteria group bacterium]
MKKKNDNKKDNKELFTGRNFWLIIPLIVICALLAGFFGQVMANYYVSEEVLQNYQSNLDLSGLNANPGLIIRDAKKVVVNEDVKLSETVNSVKSSLVSVFDKKKIAVTKLASEATSSSWTDSFVEYNLNDPLFNGLLITSDGWVFTPYSEGLMTDFVENYEEGYIVIDNSEEIYNIDEILIDKSNNLAFFHLNGAKNMNVKKNASLKDIKLGQSILAIKDTNTVYPGNITSLREVNGISSSELINYSLNTNLNEEEIKTSFVFNLAGDLMAFVNYNGDIVPTFSYNHYWINFLEKNELSRPYLGVNYLDLSKYKIVSEYSSLDKGALIWSSGLKPAVEKNSPADLAGLKEGDIITWINNIEIDKDNNLAQVVNMYYPGDKLDVIYERDGVEYNTSLSLKEISSNENIIK